MTALAAILLVLRRRAPAVLAAAACYAVVLSPVLGLTQSGPQLVADRYSHLACLPLVLLAAGGVLRLAGTRPWPAAALAVALIALSAAGTWRQAGFWRTSTTLWERGYALAPDNPGVLTSLGTLRSRQAEAERDPARALALLNEALDLHRRALARDDDPLILRNMSQVRTMMSLFDPTHAREHQEQALVHSQQAVAAAEAKNVLVPEFLLAYGTDLVNVGRIDEGIAQLERFVAVQPDRWRGLVNLAGALTMAGRPADALPHLDRACRLEPGDPRPWVGLARALEALGRNHEALAAWTRVLSLTPSDGVAAAHVRALGGGVAGGATMR